MRQINGKTTGLKSNQITRLTRLYQRRLSIDDAMSVELYKSLCDLSSETGRMVGLLIDRRGNVEEVVLGDTPNIMYLPDIGRHRGGATRLRGLRLMVAMPVKQVMPSRLPIQIPSDLLTDLERLRLDVLMVAEALPNGLAGRLAVAYLSPDHQNDEEFSRLESLGGFGGEAPKRHILEDYNQVHDYKVEFDSFIRELEDELTKKIDKRKEAEVLENERDRALLVGVYTTKASIYQPSMDELKELAKTARVNVADVVIQRRAKLDPKTVVGKGKLEEICLHALHLGADLLIFDCDLSPSQLNSITEKSDLRVIDRSMLILDIFARRATTKGGKLQVELAQSKYSLPRLAKAQEGMSRLTGGIGGTGPGETKLEVDRRRVKERISKLEKMIDKFSKERTLTRKQRNRKGVPIISIVGYTNAGKSTLLNALTGAVAYAKDELFATLDPTSRRLRFPQEREVILVDTVGFIRELPKSLVNAFRATLEELHDADFLLHVVDVTDPQREEKIKAVNTILEELGLEETPRLLVLNKCDRLDKESVAKDAESLDAVAISAINKDGFHDLLDLISDKLWRHDVVRDHEQWGQKKVTYNPMNDM